MLIGPQNLTPNVNHVRSRIDEAAKAAGRDPAAVTLVAVTKSKAAESMREAATAGVTDFGENYLKEALGKMDALGDLPLRWHFIGGPPIEQDPARGGTLRLDPQHRSLERCPAAVGAAALSCAAAELVHSGRAGSGTDQGRCRPRHWPELAAADRRCCRESEAARPDVHPAGSTGCGSERALFARLRDSARRLSTRAGHKLDTLSMGMSADFESAIAEGATHGADRHGDIRRTVSAITNEGHAQHTQAGFHRRAATWPPH